MEKSLPICLEKLEQDEEKFPSSDLPKVSVIIPTYNSSQSVVVTLDSVLEQDYPQFDVLVIDGGSSDRTLEIVNSYRSERVHIYSLPKSSRYEMINKGLAHATGSYVNILFPNDFYIHKRTLKFMMNLALEHEKPHLVYCGTLLRDGKSDVKILYRQLSLKLLKRGHQPTSLQSCWFRTDVFEVLGDFNVAFKLRGGFDFLCRFFTSKNHTWASAYRALTDYDLRWVTRRMVIRHFWETLRIIYKYFGFYRTFKWLFYQKDVSRFIKLWVRSIKVAFFGD